MAKYTSEPFGVKDRANLNRPEKDQHAATYDILSEGPIEGLANGLSSIFINDVPLIQEQAENILKPRRFKADVTASNSNITDPQFGQIRETTFQNKSGTELGVRKIAIEKAAAKGTGIASATAETFVITTSTGYFTSTMLQHCRQTRVPIFVRLAGAGVGGRELRAKITKVTSSTEATIDQPIATTVSNVDIFFDYFGTVSSISGNTATLGGAAPAQTISDANIQVSSPYLEGLNLSSLFNFKDVEVGFRTGQFNSALLPPSDNAGTSTLFTPNIKLEQANLRDVIGTTGNLVANYNDELDEPSQQEGTSADTVLTAAAMGVTAPSEVDEIHVTFAFPQSHAIKSNGSKGASFVEHQIFFEYSTDNGSSFTSELAFGPSNDDILNRTTGRDGKNVNHPISGGYGYIPNNGYVKPNPAQFTSFIEEFKIETAEFQPFDTYRIRVRRITDNNFKDNSYQHTNPSTLQSVENIIKDRLYYPYTSYAKVAFNAKDFDSNIPTRSYLLKGRKVKVPTNYFTRDENDGAATYTRNISTGATESTYQAWDGNFRGDHTTFDESSVNFEEVYTDNPVWIFYDLLTNTNYGLGQFIDADQIDKYELFRLAKFCDEEVPDGEGGTEPRFTCNVYITKSTEATNLLKQFASIFRGMAIWMDGQVTAISDRPQKPIYTFTKANVKDGAFSYEGTGEKTKVNQIKVTWNDPSDNYRQAAEYVEDTQALISSATGKAPRLIRKDILAFGTTSRGQAHRLGKWKLLSEQTENETVSFITGPNAIGLKPGDVIAIQDADRDRASYSGRVSNTGTRNTTTVPLDRSVVIPAYSSSFPPQLLLIYPSGGAYLNQDSATISSTDYSKGDLITSVTSSTAAANLVDDSNNSVDVYWSENARIESKTVSSPGTSGATVSSLTVSSAFSAAPDAEVMWSLRIFNTDGTEATGTVKEYKIISVKEAENQEFEIVAGEYNVNKFDLIERGYVIDPRPNDTFPNPEDEVPAPAHITSKLSPSESAGAETTDSSFNVGHDVSIDWDYPENSDGTRYGFVSGFEVTHDFRGKQITERVGIEDQGFTVENITGGTYTVEVRTISSINTFSLPLKRSIEFASQHFTTPTAPIKQGKLPKGGLITAPLSIDASTGNASVTAKSSSGGSFNFTNANGEVKTIDSTDTAMYNTSTTLAAGNQGDGTYQLLVDDSATALKYVNERTDTSASPSFSYFKLAGSSTGLTTRTGTITVERGSNKITGTNTTFSTHYEPGDTFHIDNGSSTTRTTGASSSNSTTVTLSSSNSDIKVGQTVTGTFFGTDEATYTNLGGSTVKTSAGEVFVTAISGTTLTVSTPITVANGVTLTFTPRTVYGTVSEVVSNTLMFLDEAVERKYEGAVHKELEFKPDNIKDTIVADVKRTTVLGNTTFSLLNEYVDYPVAEESLTFNRLDPDIIITQSDAIASNDNETTIPTSAAVKDYVDNASKNLTNIGTISSGDITITDTSTDPFLKLATSERQYVVRIDNDDSDKFQIRDVTASATRLSIDSTGLVTTVGNARVSGNLGVGRAPDSTFDLDVNGTSNFRGAITVAGAITATGDVTAFSSSDERLKTNLIKIDSALNKVTQISGYHFEWKDMDEAPHQGKDIGVIAQEIEKVLPEIVSERDTGYKAVNYQKLTALLIEAVKELKEEIDELKGNK